MRRDFWELPDFLALWSQSGRRAFSSQSISRKRPLFSQVAKSIADCAPLQTSTLAPGLAVQMLGELPLQSAITSWVPGLFWGSLCLSWPGCLTSLQRLPPPCLTASCVLRIRTTGPFNLWSMHTFSFFRRPTPPQFHVSLSALQFLEIQHT